MFLSYSCKVKVSQFQNEVIALPKFFHSYFVQCNDFIFSINLNHVPYHVSNIVLFSEALLNSFIFKYFRFLYFWFYIWEYMGYNNLCSITRYQDTVLYVMLTSSSLDILANRWQKIEQKQLNVCFIKIRSKHNSNTLLSLLRNFMKQTLV